jgi:hypothetical protein
MSKVLFPKRNADGSFCIDVVIAIETNEPGDLSHRVKSWAAQWVRENHIWARHWTQSERDETLNYTQEFKREPYPVSCTPTELTIRFEGQPSAKWWKDWLVLKILSDLKSAFVEFRDVTRMRDCNDFSSTDDR